MNFRSLFLKHLAQTSPEPMGLEIVKSKGLYLWDRDHKRYADMISGIGVSSIGHQHPAVVAAVKDQVDQYMHTLVYGEFVLEPQVRYAKKLTDMLHPSLNSIYLVNSGAEATEAGLKLAKRYTGRPKIVSCFESYHGSTTGAMALNSDAYFHRPYRPLMPGVSHIHFNDLADLKIIDEFTAAVVVEPVQAERGLYPPDPGYLEALRRRCSEVGALLIMDEIQTGFGRTGRLFAHQKYDVVPDIMLIAKGMGGGMPIGGMVADKKLMDVFSHDPVLGHITTFGGHPVTCAAALATLNVLLKEDYIDSVQSKEAYIRKVMHHDKIKELRTAGLWAAIELYSEAEMHSVVKKGLERGYIYDWFLFNAQSVRIAPPLNITMEELETACLHLLEILDEI
ncbi:aspartate aminotransferase family protein [Membranihabitans marinus]|uniref:aspartate aminotransferase family protein n=1 Tax=Membranihabitans marinus TaxID=1227546 RepID=UPI001F022D2D|nr:aminotransferase class III-fold pyridoxal phosphate-dependent enzyme [Membranihabitans marinus]